MPDWNHDSELSADGSRLYGHDDQRETHCAASVAGSASALRGLVPPATDLAQTSSWDGYRIAKKEKGITSGFDCPIRAGSQGQAASACAWRPKDRTDGHPTLSRVKEHVAGHGLVCDKCQMVLGTQQKWKQHRAKFKRKGACPDDDEPDSRERRHKIELPSSNIDNYFKCQVGPSGSAEQAWLDGFRELHPHWTSQLPSAYYRLNANKELGRSTDSSSGHSRRPSLATSSDARSPTGLAASGSYDDSGSSIHDPYRITAPINTISGGAYLNADLPGSAHDSMFDQSALAEEASATWYDPCTLSYGLAEETHSTGQRYSHARIRVNQQISSSQHAPGPDIVVSQMDLDDRASITPPGRLVARNSSTEADDLMDEDDEPKISSSSGLYDIDNGGITPFDDSAFFEEMSSIHSHGRDPESQREIERLKNEVERLSKENTRLSKENEEYQQEREALHDQIEEQKLELMHSRGTIDKIRRHLGNLIATLRRNLGQRREPDQRLEAHRPFVEGVAAVSNGTQPT